MTDDPVAVMLGAALVLLGVNWFLMGLGWYPFHGGRLLPRFKRRKKASTWSDMVTTRAAYDRTIRARMNGKQSDWTTSWAPITHWQMSVAEYNRKAPNMNGTYLVNNGKAHECETPSYTWKRGDTLNTVWQCECGSKYNLEAHVWKTRPVPEWRSLYGGIGRPAAEGVPGRKLTYADVLKIGNRVDTYNEYTSITSYTTVPRTRTSEEIINREVSFTWTKFTVTKGDK